MPAQHPAVANGSYFITQVVKDRHPLFRNVVACELLLNSLRAAKSFHPFSMIAYVLLPDHFHLMIQPQETISVALIMASAKAMFTRDHKRRLGIDGKMAVWQDGFFDHVIRDPVDLQRHLDYIHYNPVRHGLVQRPEAWLWSTFGEWKKRGAYADMWGWSLPETIAKWGLAEPSPDDV